MRVTRLPIDRCLPLRKKGRKRDGEFVQAANSPYLSDKKSRCCRAGTSRRPYGGGGDARMPLSVTSASRRDSSPRRGSQERRHLRRGGFLSVSLRGGDGGPHPALRATFPVRGEGFGRAADSWSTAGGEMRGCPSQSRRQADATAPPEGGAKSDGICGEGGECIYPHQYAAEQCSMPPSNARRYGAPHFRKGGQGRAVEDASPYTGDDTSEQIRKTGAVWETAPPFYTGFSRAGGRGRCRSPGRRGRR